MRISKHTDYALRVLMDLAEQPNQSFTTQKIAAHHSISLHHLVKVVHRLSRSNYIEIKRGRNGGIRLAREASDVSVREIVELCEPDFKLAGCFQPGPTKCVVSKNCFLKSCLSDAMAHFLTHLQKYSLQDLISGRS